MMNMKDTKKNLSDIINQNIADEFLKSEEHQQQTKDIVYSVTKENGKYKIKVYKDDEGLLDKHLDKTKE